MSDTCDARSGRDALARIAAGGHGVFTRAHALSCGLSARAIDRRAAGGTWVRLYPGVYRLAGAPVSWRGSLLAACLAWGDGAVASHRSATALWGLPGSSEGAIELTVPPKRDRAHPHRIHRNALTSGEMTVRDAVPVTSVARTLLDLAATGHAARAEDALDDALRRRLITAPRLIRWFEQMRRPGLRGSRVLGELLAARADAPAASVPQSVLETRLVRLLRDAGVSSPARQHEVRVGARRLVLDFAWVEQRVAVEADGYSWHASRRRFDRDRARHNVLTAAGWTVLHVTWPQLRARPGEVVAVIRSTLASRGRPAL